MKIFKFTHMKVEFTSQVPKDTCEEYFLYKVPNFPQVKLFRARFANPSAIQGSSNSAPPLVYLVDPAPNCPSPTSEAPPSHNKTISNPPHSLLFLQSTPTKMAATNAYPPGGTFLDTLKKSFTDVPVDKEKDNAVSTTEFLEAAESLTTLFGTCLFPVLCGIAC